MLSGFVSFSVHVYMYGIYIYLNKDIYLFVQYNTDIERWNVE